MITMLAVDIGGKTGPNYPVIAVLGLVVVALIVHAVMTDGDKKRPRH